MNHPLIRAPRRLVLLALMGLAPGLALAQAPTQELTVSAAASLTNAFQDIAKAFERAHPGSKVVLNFAASGPLLQQIRQGAPVDVFASADQETMDKAAAAQLLAPGRVDSPPTSISCAPSGRRVTRSVGSTATSCLRCGSVADGRS